MHFAFYKFGYPDTSPIIFNCKEPSLKFFPISLQIKSQASSNLLMHCQFNIKKTFNKQKKRQRNRCGSKCMIYLLKFKTVVSPRRPRQNMQNAFQQRILSYVCLYITLPNLCAILLCHETQLTLIYFLSLI